MMKLVCAALLAALCAVAQQPNQRVYRQPDCVAAFTISVGTGSAGQHFDNRYRGCNTWVLTYYARDYAGLQVQVQGFGVGPDGTPSGFAPLLPTMGGSNPLVVEAGFGTLTFNGYAPWVRVAAIVAGSDPDYYFAGTLSGWNEPSGGSAMPVPCSMQTAVTLSAAGSTQVIAAAAGQTVRVCGVFLNSASAQDISIISGTGANCATGPTNLTGLFRQTAALNISTATGFAAPVGAAVCINQGSAVNTGGLILYDRR